MKIHEIKRDKDWSWPDEIIARELEISEEQAQEIIKAEVGPNGRSPWHLIRLMSGDLVLACYPCGDTFDNTEKYRETL